MDADGGTVRDNGDVNSHVAGNTALGRVGQPDEIGAVIALLLASGSQWINAWKRRLGCFHKLQIKRSQPRFTRQLLQGSHSNVGAVE